jgi:hypothetical protein
VELEDRYVEVFLIASWGEHLRQHERQTVADQELENKLRECLVSDPKIHHLLYASTSD